MIEAPTLEDLIERAIGRFCLVLLANPEADDPEMAGLPMDHADWVNSTVLSDVAYAVVNSVSDEVLLQMVLDDRDMAEIVSQLEDRGISAIKHLHWGLYDFLKETSYYWFQDRHVNDHIPTLAELCEAAIEQLKQYLGKEWPKSDSHLHDLIYAAANARVEPISHQKIFKMYENDPDLKGLPTKQYGDNISVADILKWTIEAQVVEAIWEWYRQHQAPDGPG